MVTVTVSMGIHNKTPRPNAAKFDYCLLVMICGLAFSHELRAFDWQLRPNLSMMEMFSDNLALSDNAKKSGFVTEVAPGVSIYGVSPWSNFNLNYRLQGLYNAGGRDAVDINHQLQMNSLYQAVRNTLFLQMNSSISQQNSNNSYIASDNLSGNGSRTEVRTFNVSPYWTPHFGQYASGLFKVGYQSTNFDNAVNDIANQNSISDSETISTQGRLSSGSKFNVLRWNLNYSSQDQSSVSAQDVRFEQYQGDVRYYINRKFNVFGNIGYENNDYQSLSNSINNGFFYTFGGQWNPSKWYSLEAGYGNNKHVSMRFNPSANLFGYVTYRDKDVGLNNGSSWDANLRYIAQHATVNFTYSQETTTVQQLLAQQAVFNPVGAEIDPVTGQLLDPSSGLIFDPVTGQILNPNLPNFVNDVLVNKQANLSFSYRTGKSSYNLSVYNSRRSYELSPQEDNVYGASGNWDWQFAPRLSLYLRPTWQSSEFSNSVNGASTNERYDLALGLTRAIPINLGRPLMMNTRLEFRHINQSSDQSINDYTENRATANFAVRF